MITSLSIETHAKESRIKFCSPLKISISIESEIFIPNSDSLDSSRSLFDSNARLIQSKFLNSFSSQFYNGIEKYFFTFTLDNNFSFSKSGGNDN